MPGSDPLPVLGLDADDTLWESEARFHQVEARFRDLMAPWSDEAATDAAMLATERKNIVRHGYGVKGFVLSMIVTACLLYTSPSPRDGLLSRMPSSA